jgi:hypothetical protein
MWTVYSLMILMKLIKSIWKKLLAGYNMGDNH